MKIMSIVFVTAVLSFLNLAGPARGGVIVHQAAIQVGPGAVSDGPKVAFNGDLCVSMAGDGIHPEREDVVVSISFGDMTPFYKVVIPGGQLVTSEAGDHYGLSDSARNTLGLEKFEMNRRPDGRWEVRFSDRRTTLPEENYAFVCYALRIGDDAGAGCTYLTPGGASWATR